ncbi:TOBE domain-containing protein [Actinopolymorpha pittospori]|uniref:TOBE domain-containing protein n=1 Tax=Actinopolymorpha pittospori TaxID=648752 RepID=UPI00308045EE
MLIRPEQLRLGDPAASACVAEVTRTAFDGHDALVELRLEAHAGGDANVCARTLGGETPPVGSRVVGEPHVIGIHDAPAR